MNARAVAMLLGASFVLAACAAAPRWLDDVGPVLRRARDAGQEVVVFFALPGRDASDRMQQSLGDPQILDALTDGDFAAVVVDGNVRTNLYATWVGGGEGMGIAVLGKDGQCYAARPGPQDPPELAAFLRLCAGARGELATLRGKAELASASPLDQHALGCAYLMLGCRKQSEPLLFAAAGAGVADARHRLARLFALDGNLVQARRWLQVAPKTPAAQVTEGYVLFKERKHADAVQVLDAALATGQLGLERQRALLYLGKALHEDKQDERALPMLESLAAEGTGSTFEAAALHTLGHIRNPQHGHTH